MQVMSLDGSKSQGAEISRVIWRVAERLDIQYAPCLCVVMMPTKVTWKVHVTFACLECVLAASRGKAGVY